MKEWSHVQTSIDHKTCKIGWVGTGVMGLPMCGHLHAAGYPVRFTTRSRAKAKSLEELGIGFLDDPRRIAQWADIVFTMVGFPDDVHQVYFGDAGLLSAVSSGKMLIDMTTTEPSLAQNIAQSAAAAGACALDAPVSGGDVGARNATLSIMVGGDCAAFDTLHPLLRLLGKNIVYQGGPGSGQHAKMCNQIVIASTMVGVCESLLYGTAAGLNLHTMLESIRRGAAGCWTLDNLAPRILDRNFDPGFFVIHFLKDMRIALAESKRMGLDLKGLNLALQLYEKTVELGHGQLGTHALMLALEDLAGGLPSRDAP